MRKLVAAVLASVPLVGCAGLQQALFKSKFDAASAQLQAEGQACAAKRASGAIKTNADQARCLNEAEDRTIRPLLHGDLISLRQAYRVSLATKVDRKLLSMAEAERQFVRATSKIVAKAQARNSTSQLVAAQVDPRHTANEAWVRLGLP